MSIFATFFMRLYLQRDVPRQNGIFKLGVEIMLLYETNGDDGIFF